MFRLLFLLFLLSCSDDLVNNDSTVSIKNLIVEVDRSTNELYMQVEVSTDRTGYNPVYNEELLIDLVGVNLEYVGGTGINYSNSFLLYDDGQNGDIIANNGIYTLIDQADKVDAPDEQAEIVNINIPTYYRVDNTDSGDISFTITIKGKKYLATVSVFENDNVHTLEEYLNIDNTSLEIEINKSELYIDNPDTEVCDRVPDTYEDIFYPVLWDWPDATSDGLNDYFTYESGFSVSSMEDCASTGISKFKFILNDLDDNESDSEERSIIIFGCGDNICEPNHESISSCPEDCIDE